MTACKHGNVFVCAAAALLLASSPASQVLAAPACSMPMEMVDDQPILFKTARALRSGGPVRIIALGGSSTLGRAAGGGEAAWPAVLARALREMFPNTPIEVENLSRSRRSAEEMVAAIASDVVAEKPTLVIWETGITDTVRGTDLNAFSETLQRGIDALRASGSEVAIMDMQFSRTSEFILGFRHYAEVLRGTAEINDVPVFPRHNLMRLWSETGVFDYYVRGREARRKLATEVYDCIGRAVAAMIARKPGPVQ